jgi:hypothetical protein
LNKVDPERSVSFSCAKGILDYNTFVIPELWQVFGRAQAWRADLAVRKREITTLFHITLAHTEDNCPIYQREMMPGVLESFVNLGTPRCLAAAIKAMISFHNWRNLVDIGQPTYARKNAYHIRKPQFPNIDTNSNYAPSHPTQPCTVRYIQTYPSTNTRATNRNSARDTGAIRSKHCKISATASSCSGLEGVLL